MSRRAPRDLALRQVEKAYQDESVREYELTKPLLAAVPFPDGVFADQEKRAGARSSFSGMDVRYGLSGQYMRRIRNITLTLARIYRSVQRRPLPRDAAGAARRASIRSWNFPATRCCAECSAGQDYETCAHDPRMVILRGARSDRDVEQPERLRAVRAEFPGRAISAVRIPGRGEALEDRTAS